jgi:hypothetical protein
MPPDLTRLAATSATTTAAGNVVDDDDDDDDDDQHMPDLALGSFVIDAVYAYAYAIRNLLKDRYYHTKSVNKYIIE